MFLLQYICAVKVRERREECRDLVDKYSGTLQQRQRRNTGRAPRVFTYGTHVARTPYQPSGQGAAVPRARRICTMGGRTGVRHHQRILRRQRVGDTTWRTPPPTIRGIRAEDVGRIEQYVAATSDLNKNEDGVWAYSPVRFEVRD